ncbi:E3 ubiquitin-protein ligase MIEL1 [Zea mays]|uniref:E3 ubiquitin-protein ligase MIEL1 n=1 Tax=Zea mays TaxID=4577 RepID=A0A317YC43_MAIZE|nr:E3 ubiquitin-protein ligase MIEL1 [Zea mays]
MDGDAGPEQHGCVHYRRGCKIRAPCCGEVAWFPHCRTRWRSASTTATCFPVTTSSWLSALSATKNRMCSKTVRTAEHVSANTSARNATSSTTISVPSSVFSGFVVAFPGISGVEEPISLRWVRHMQARLVAQRISITVADVLLATVSIRLDESYQRAPLRTHHPPGMPLRDESAPAVSLRFSCPVCLRSACNMSDIWQKLDQQVAASPMPAIYQKKMVWILCNDCGVTSNVQFHILAHKCPGCSSYNTRQTRGDPAACSRV